VPILHNHYQFQGLKPDGTQTLIAPRVGLQIQGPIVQAIVSLSPAFIAAMTDHGETLPPPKSGLVLIDTGASSTCVDLEAAATMGLPVIDVARMTSATHSEVECPVYPIQLQIVGLPLVFQARRALGAALSAQGLLALIGRDALAGALFIYNGPSGEITLCL
jgi:predicted aspartyl protease